MSENLKNHVLDYNLYILTKYEDGLEQKVILLEELGHILHNSL